jgi:hypothetical protein
VGVKHKKKPVVDRIAWHKGGLDPRRVAEVSEDGTQIRLDILGYITTWLPAENYTYTEAPSNG